MAESTKTAVATAAPSEVAKPQAKTVSVKTFIFQNTKAIEAALPRVGLTPEAVARAAWSQVYKNPELGRCDRNSLMRAIIEAASLGLSFSLGRAYLVPFNNKIKDKASGRETWRLEAQFMPGYQGLVDLVRRSSSVKTVAAAAVYEGDKFSYSTGLTDDTFEHISLTDPDPAKLTHTYCIIRFLDGGYQFVVLTRKQIDSVRARSKAKNFGPWVTDYDAMAIKTAVKRCTKLCPASIELARAIEHDNSIEMGETPPLALTDGTEFQDERDPEQEAEKPSTTQAVSQQAAKTLEMVRASAPDAPESDTAGEGPEPSEEASEVKPGPGRPANCPGFGGNPCPDKNKLRTAKEKGFALCESCRQRRESGTTPAAGADQASPAIELSALDSPDPTPQQIGAFQDDPIVKLAWKARMMFIISTGNLSRAEIHLSELSGGKVQKFSALPEYLRTWPEFIEKLQEAMK